MEIEWNKLSVAERADFSAWRQQKQAEADAQALADAQAAAAPKKYVDMTDAEKRAWLGGHGIRVPHGSKP